MVKQSSEDKPIKRPTYPGSEDKPIKRFPYPEGVLPGRDFGVDPPNDGAGKPRLRKRPKNGGEIKDLDPIRERRPRA